MRGYGIVRPAIIAVAVVLAAGLAGGCATTGAGADGANRDRLTSAEIRSANLPNAYELVSRLRRAWLRDDPLTGESVAVYMEERRLGGAETLREIPAVEVAELRFIGHNDATMRWGMGVTGSVIEVVRR